MKKLMVAVLMCGAASMAARAQAQPARAQSGADWSTYAYDAGGSRFSPLKQITAANVAQLKQVWSYSLRPPGAPKAGSAPAAPTPGDRRGDAGISSATEFSPLVIKGVMYTATPFRQIVAIDTVTGQQKWAFTMPGTEPLIGRQWPRGFHYWAGDASHSPRLVMLSANLKLFTLDPDTGKINSTYGANGMLDLRTPDVMGNFPTGLLNANSAPVMYKNIVIIGTKGQEAPQKGPRGDVRGIDIVTGKTLWKFNAIPEPGERNFGTWQGDSWKDRAGVEPWNAITVDDERGIAYLPFAAPAIDRDGRDRIGDGLYGNTLVAVNAVTGKYMWHFQTVHHDIWDLDLPGIPTLMDVKRDGKIIPAVAAINKTAILFILDRVTGKPLYDVKEVPVPKSNLPGEAASPTQPFPSKPEPLGRLSINLDTDISDATPEHEAFCKKLVADNHLIGSTMFTPLGFNQPTINFPGAGGGVNWGGGAFDKADGYYIVNITNKAGRGFISMQPDGSLRMNGGWFADVSNGDMRPCQKGPWGELVAVNVSTGDIAWRSTLGVTDSFPPGKQLTGRQSTGGPIVTAGGLIFIAATDDDRFRAFDAKTGKMVWETKLDAAGHTTPITYLGRDGKQYVSLVATGGSYLADPNTSDTMVTYALP